MCKVTPSTSPIANFKGSLVFQQTHLIIQKVVDELLVPMANIIILTLAKLALLCNACDLHLTDVIVHLSYAGCGDFIVMVVALAHLGGNEVRYPQDCLHLGIYVRTYLCCLC